MNERSCPVLTEAQKEALRLVHRGMSTKEIAVELGISVDSVTDRIERARVHFGGVRRQTAARLLAEAEAPPMPFGVPGKADGVSYPTALGHLDEVAAGGDELREQRVPFVTQPLEPLIERLGPLGISGAIVGVAIAFMAMGALMKPMIDGIGWLANATAGVFK